MTTARRQSPPGGRWLIPVILVILIAAVVLGALFGGRIKDALSKKSTATPTPQKIVVTATPSAATATPGGPTATPGGPTPTPGGAAALPGGVPATATPGSVGISTPLPGTTPLPTVPGLQVGMIARPAKRVAFVQTQASNGDPNYIYYLNPTKVLNYNLPAYGFTNGFTVVRPTTANPTPTPYKGTDGRPVVKYYVRYQGKIYTVQVVQPGTAGPTGIWVIATIFQGQQ